MSTSEDNEKSHLEDANIDRGQWKLTRKGIQLRAINKITMSFGCHCWRRVETQMRITSSSISCLMSCYHNHRKRSCSTAFDHSLSLCIQHFTATCHVPLLTSFAILRLDTPVVVCTLLFSYRLHVIHAPRFSYSNRNGSQNDFCFLTFHVLICIFFYDAIAILDVRNEISSNLHNKSRLCSGHFLHRTHSS